MDVQKLFLSLYFYPINFKSIYYLIGWVACVLCTSCDEAEPPTETVVSKPVEPLEEPWVKIEQAGMTFSLPAQPEYRKVSLGENYVEHRWVLRQKQDQVQYRVSLENLPDTVRLDSAYLAYCKTVFGVTNWETVAYKLEEETSSSIQAQGQNASGFVDLKIIQSGSQRTTLIRQTEMLLTDSTQRVRFFDQFAGMR